MPDTVLSSNTCMQHICYITCSKHIVILHLVVLLYEIHATNNLKLSPAQALLIFPASALELITCCINENTKNSVRILRIFSWITACFAMGNVLRPTYALLCTANGMASISLTIRNKSCFKSTQVRGSVAAIRVILYECFVKVESRTATEANIDVAC